MELIIYAFQSDTRAVDYETAGRGRSEEAAAEGVRRGKVSPLGGQAQTPVARGSGGQGHPDQGDHPHTSGCRHAQHTTCSHKNKCDQKTKLPNLPKCLKNDQNEQNEQKNKMTKMNKMNKK